MNKRLGIFQNRVLDQAAKEKLFFLFRQMLITGTNALVGFVLLRGLSKMEFAVYTIVFALLAIFTNITNVGITPAMSGIGGRVWNNRRSMQALLNTALRLRGQLGWWFAGPFVAYCVWQFWETGLGWTPLILLVLLLLFAAWIQLQSAFYAIILQLNKAVPGLQRNELWLVLLKLAGVLLLVWLNAPVVVVVAWICGCLFLNLKANQILAGHYLEPHGETNAQFQAEINGIIRSNFFRTVYWSLEGQISILLCTLFASTNSIADIGALGRLSVYFAIFQAFIINYSLPRLAKSQEKGIILHQLRRILLLTIAFILPILAWATVHPKSLLWVLGPNYATLERHLFTYLFAVSIGQLAGVVYQVCAAKAWIQINRYYVPIALPLQIALIYFLNLAELSQVIIFIGINNLFFLLFNSIMFYHAFHRQQPQTVLN